MASTERRQEYEQKRRAIEAEHEAKLAEAETEPARKVADEAVLRKFTALERAYADVIKAKGRDEDLPAWGYQTTLTIVSQGEPEEDWTERMIKLLKELDMPPQTVFCSFTVDAVKEPPSGPPDQGETP